MESDSDSQFSVVLEDGGNSGTEVGVGDEGTELVEEEREENMDRGIGEDSMAALEENQPVVGEEQMLEDPDMIFVKSFTLADFGLIIFYPKAPNSRHITFCDKSA